MLFTLPVVTFPAARSPKQRKAKIRGSLEVSSIFKSVQKFKQLTLPFNVLLKGQILVGE